MSLTAIAFVLLFAVMNVMALTRNPIFGVMLYVMLVFIDPPSRWWGHALPDLRWSLTAAAITMIGMLVHKPATPALPFGRHGVVWLMVAFVVWLCIQCGWALELDMQLNLLNYFVKYIVAMYLLYRCVDSEKHLRMFLWAFVLGCSYLAWVAFTGYKGGRFDEFGGAGIGEANAGALTLVLGMLVAGGLFLESSRKERVALLLLVPFMANAVIMTISRSGSLALVAGGLTFNLFTPPRYRMRVLLLSVLAAGVFVYLTDPGYWQRIDTVKYAGAEVNGVDTSAGRLDILRAQQRMFRDHPLGCGHHCTMVLSPSYMEEKTLEKSTGERASHNTFMSMLVEHGIPGGIYYLLMYAWAYLTIRKLNRQRSSLSPLTRVLMTSVAACLGAQFVADQFVPYVRYEVRYWIIAVAMMALNLAAMARREQVGAAPAVEQSRDRLPVGEPRHQVTA